VPGGRITLSLSATGRNDATRELNLIKDRAVTVLLDPKGLLHRSIGRFTTGSNPKQVAFTPDGKEIWASLLGGRGLQVFDSAGNKLDDITLGAKGGAVEVIFTRDGTKAYASQMETASVFEIDRVTRKVLRQLPTKGVWTKVLILSPDEKTLYAANWSSNDVSEIDLATGTVVRRIPTVVTPRGLYITPDGARMYVAGYDNGEIQRIDLGTGRGKVLLKTGGAMRHMVGNAEGTRLYADDMAKDVVFVVDLTTDTVTQLAKTDEKPNTIDLTPDGRVLYVSCRGENGSNYYLPGPEWGSVLAIDAQTGRILDAMVGGNQCTGLDVSPDGKMLAFSDFLDNKVRLYAIPPTQVLLDGDGGRATTHLADIAKN
jgi:YVTN family beta-propeller protein